MAPWSSDMVRRPLDRLALRLRYAAGSLWRHRGRSLISMVGVICGIASLLAMHSVGEGARREALAQIEQLGTRNVLIRALPAADTAAPAGNRVASLGLHLADTERLRIGVSEVAAVAALRELPRQGSDGGSALVPTLLAVTPDLAPVLRLEIARGRQISDADRSNPVCVLGDALARSLGVQGQPGQLMRLQTGQCRIIGVLRRFDPRRAKGAPVTARDFDHAALIPLRAASAFGADGDDVLTEIVVQLRDSTQLIQAVPLIRRVLDLHHHGAGDFEFIEPRGLLQQARAMQSTFNLALGAITGICLLTGGVGVMNAMLASVVERRREIGVRRCLGARQRDIAAEFLAEAQLLCGTGGLLGLLLGALLAQTLSRWTGWPSVLDLPSVTLALLVALGTGALSGLYPAWMAARMDPIQALRHV